MKDTVLFYHANCPDGFGAAYAFWCKYKDTIEYYPISHGDDLPDVTGKTVFFADIAMDRDITIRAAEQAKKIKVIDHHISKYEELKDLPYYIYSSEYSGAGMAWRFCHPNKEMPLVIQYVQDRDIWKWELDHGKEILASLDSLPFTFQDWHAFEADLHEKFDRVCDMGEGILQYCERLMSRIKRDKHTLTIKGHVVPAINTPFFRSEILAQLCIDHPFSAGYHYDGEKFIFSLRSYDEGLDVAEIAAMFPGGGGHRNASGFQVKSLDELNE